MSRRIRPFAAVAALIGAALVALLPAVPATAATAPTAATAATGWVRVAHLSPDTKQVDVTLSSLSGSTVLYKLSSVGYGAVSQYIKLPAGTYAIAMVPAGAPAGSTPVVKASVTVDAGKASTVAALGLNTALETHVYADDLTAPASGSARVRVLNASTKHRSVTLKVGSQTVASDQAFASASPYTDVPAGTESVTMTSSGTTKTASASLPAGSVHTLFVLDTASGGLTVSPILESSAAAVTPSGAIDTGAGGLARPGGTPLLAGALAGIVGLGAVATGGLLLRRRAVGVQH